jgi:hypothetical protein
MTLVVARLTPAGPRIVSDLRVIDEHATRSGYTEGVLKAILLTPEVCVAFAGNVNGGVEAVRRCAEGAAGGFNLEEAESALLDAHCAAGQETDFLIAVRRPASISRVRAGDIERGLPTAWIGDHAAFAEYQERYLSAPISELPPGVGNRREELEIGARMSHAFGGMIRDGAIATVGEAEISITPQWDGLRYAHSATAMIGHTQQIPSGVPARIQFGSAAQGGFTYTVGVPAEAGVGAVGLHFFQGRFGLLYHPTVLGPRPEPFPNATSEEFEMGVRRKFGIRLVASRVS